MDNKIHQPPIVRPLEPQSGLSAGPLAFHIFENHSFRGYNCGHVKGGPSMEEKVLAVASRVTKPISLASLAMIVLYLGYKIVFGLRIFVDLTESHTFDIVNSVIDKLFYVALLSLVCGIGSYLYVQHINTKMSVNAHRCILTGNVYFGNGKPVEGATVFVEGIDRQRKTDATGWFSIETDKKESWSIKALFNEEIATQAVTKSEAEKPVRLIFEDKTISTADSPQSENSTPDEKATTSWEKDTIVDHDKLFGVSDLLKTLGEYLGSADKGWFISLFGEGGIGKTSIAYELVKGYAREAGFTKIAWVSAKPMYMSSTGELRHKDIDFYWSDFVKNIADRLELDIGLNPAVWKKQFPENLRLLPTKEKFLIIIDNLETIRDAQEIITYFDNEGVVNPHKVIITTRKSVYEYSDRVYEQRIERLDYYYACDFIRHLGTGDPSIESASNLQLTPIVDVTEGNPFLIKLIIKLVRVKKQPLDIVVEDLKQGRSQLQERIKDYLYAQSLHELEKQAGEELTMQFMNAFCYKPPGSLFSYDELLQYSQIDDRLVFEQVRQLACKLSIVRASEMYSQYSIHGLLQDFICTVGQDVA